MLHAKPARRGENASQGVLIINTGVLGDTLLFLDAFARMLRYYSGQEVPVTLVCNASVKGLYETLDGVFDIIPVEVRDRWPDEASFRTAAKLLSGHYKKLIVVHHNAWGHMLAARTGADQKYFLCYPGWKQGRNILIRSIIRSNYSDVVRVRHNTFLPEAYAVLMKKLGIPGRYHPRKSFLGDQFAKEEGAAGAPYIILAPVANTNERTLAADQIARLLQILVSVSHHRIYVTGMAKDAAFLDRCIRQAFETVPPVVINYAGQTSYEEFQKLVFYADLLVGVESGHIHLAAAYGVPSVCICSLANRGQFFPYAYEKQSASDPRCVYSRQAYSCADCRSRTGNISDPVCRKRVKEHRSFLCMSQLDYEQIEKAVTEAIKEQI